MIWFDNPGSRCVGCFFFFTLFLNLSHTHDRVTPQWLLAAHRVFARQCVRLAVEKQAVGSFLSFRRGAQRLLCYHPPPASPLVSIISSSTALQTVSLYPSRQSPSSDPLLRLSLLFSTSQSRVILLSPSPISPALN